METKNFKHIIKRDNTMVPFTPVRITNAIYRAAISVGGHDLKTAEYLTGKVIHYLEQTIKDDRVPHVEDIQDAIEKVLIENGHAKTSKSFILYRNQRAASRQEKEMAGYTHRPQDTIPWKKIWDSLNWAIDHQVHNVYGLNKRVVDGSFPELIRECEESYQLEIARASDTILRRRDEIRFVIVAGPSSSGKTTSTIKISEHLKNEGFEFIPYHVDNYFFDLVAHPQDEHGDYDYETPEALDLELLNRHLKEIYEGKEVHPPYFNFKSGKREGTSQPIHLDKGQILLIDSLHGLDERMTSGIPADAKARLYIEPLLQMRTNDGNYIRWTDIRLIRRIVRDKRERNVMPDQTLLHWHYVRRSDLRYIIPNINSADYIINSSLPYELAIWSSYIKDIFREWTDKYADDKDHIDAARRSERVYRLLNDITPWKDESIIPPCALLREFIGGSLYSY